MCNLSSCVAKSNMWNKESQLVQQPIFNQFSQPFICNQQSCMRYFQKANQPPSAVKSSCRSSLLNSKKDAIVKQINGHQIKDLQKSPPCKIPLARKNNILVKPEKIVRKPRIVSESKSADCHCSEKCSCTNGLKNGISEHGFNKIRRNETNKNKASLKNGYSDHNHRKKNVKLKVDDIDVEEKEIVLKSSQRLQFLNNLTEPSVPTNNLTTKKLLELQDSLIEIQINGKPTKVVDCQSKRITRSSPISVCSRKIENNIEKKTTKDNKEKPSKLTEPGASVFKCEWNDCSSLLSSSEDLTKHVQSRHILPTADNDVFVCSWRGCKFTNQPSCSFKWLSKHVVGHCDLKPFKCVILGCDVTFSTQNGLARHVPTHFNESRVRRACVITSEAAKQDHCKQRNSSNASLVSCVSTVDGEGKQTDTDEKASHSRFQKFVNSNINLTTCSNYSSKTYNHIKKKVQKGTCQPSTNSGYLNKAFRIEHKVIGRRTRPDGTAEMLLTPSLGNLFQDSSFWCDTKEFRKRKHNHIDLQMKDMSEEIKNRLYDAEHGGSTSRRRKKRK